MSKKYQDDNECLNNDSQYRVDGGTVIVGYMMIALCVIGIGLIIKALLF